MCLRCIFLCSPVFARCYASATFAVMRCLSVCPSACFCLSRSWILSKPINISSLFSPSGSHTVLVFFLTSNVIVIFRRGPPSEGGGRTQVGYAQIAILDEYLVVDRWTGGVRTTATVHRAVYRTDATHQWVFVYHNQHGRPRWREEKRIYL